MEGNMNTEKATLFGLGESGATCVNCLFFYLTQVTEPNPLVLIELPDGTTGSEAGGKAHGQCRRHAPLPNEKILFEDLSNVVNPVWPRVDGETWCGEFVVRGTEQ
jgi:hypothetical protein